jgi:hypothetical protein
VWSWTTRTGCSGFGGLGILAFLEEEEDETACDET